MKLQWKREDLSCLRKHRDFCVDYMLKGVDLKGSAVTLTEIIDDVERKNTKGTAQRKLVVRWC